MAERDVVREVEGEMISGSGSKFGNLMPPIRSAIFYGGVAKMLWLSSIILLDVAARAAKKNLYLIRSQPQR